MNATEETSETSELVGEVAKVFILAGNATFTLVSKKTGVRFTYRVRASKSGGPRYFVSVLTGSNNESDYEYLGTIFPEGLRYYHGKKSRISPTAPSAKAFEWFFGRLIAGRPTEEAEIHHCGKCGKCGRKLTVPTSIEIGLGPECADKV